MWKVNCEKVQLLYWGVSGVKHTEVTVFVNPDEDSKQHSQA